MGMPGIAICDDWCALLLRPSQCIDLITVRFRPISGFNSADKAEWSM
jgi:hypothetical protein